MRSTEIPVHAGIIEGNRVAIAGVQQSGVPCAAVGRGGMRGWSVIGPGNGGTWRDRDTEHTRIEIEVLNGDRRDRTRGRRDLCGWCGGRGDWSHRAIQREHPERVAARIVKLEVATRGYRDVLLTVDHVRHRRRVGARAGLELPQ